MKALHWLSLGAKLLPIQVDAAGARADSLSGSRARLVYVTPSHQFPLGFTMTAEHRRKFIGWAEANDGVIIEDDYDSDVRYQPTGPTLLAETDVRVGGRFRVVFETLDGERHENGGEVRSTSSSGWWPNTMQFNSSDKARVKAMITSTDQITEWPT